MGQDDGQVYRVLKVGGQETLSGYLTCWLDLAPDNTTVGLSSTQGFPYRSFPIDGEASVQEMDIANQRYIPHGVNPPPCYADFNQDGGIDGADVEAFFGAWENGDGAADVNQDGGIDGADVETFFFAWENGACP